MDAFEKGWQGALGELSCQMTPATFNTWLQGTHVARVEGNVAYIGVRHAYALDWLQYRLLPSIRETVARHFPPGTELRFIVDGGQAPEQVQAIDDDILEQPIMEAVREEKVQIGGPAGTLTWTDFYIKLKLAFRRKALRELRGAPLSVFLCLALHMDKDGVAYPGIETIMSETGYTSRATVCSALDALVKLGLCTKRSSYRGNDEYVVNGYAWFGKEPAPSLWEATKK